ncbi:MAG: flippase-like domain-containing protein [Acidobacteriota bacterium]|nr:flippase-like domain-containing protein [Acidobacteriota bacterium]
MFALVVWLILTKLSFKEVVQAFSQVRPEYLVPIVLVLTPLGVVVRTWKWRWLLPSGRHVPFSTFVGAYLIGNLANSVLLGKFGDLVKAKVICDTKIDYGRSVAVVVIDRLLEGAALLLIFAVVLLTSTLPSWAYQLALVAGLVAVGALVTLRLIFHRREWFLKTAERILGLLPARLAGKLMTWLRLLVDGCDVMTDYRRLLVAFLVDFVAWAIDTTIIAIFLSAFSIHAPLVLASIVLLVVLNFGMLAPISPASVGVYQLLCVFALSLWRVDRQLGFAIGITMQMVIFIPLYAAGLVAILLLKRGKRSKTVTVAEAS